MERETVLCFPRETFASEEYQRGLRPMRHLLLVAALFNRQATASSFHPLPMGEVHACAVEYASQAVLSGTWGGQIATYDAIVDADGAVVSLKRRIVDGREHLPPLVKLNKLNAMYSTVALGNAANMVCLYF